MRVRQCSRSRSSDARRADQKGLGRPGQHGLGRHRQKGAYPRDDGLTGDGETGENEKSDG